MIRRGIEGGLRRKDGKLSGRRLDEKAEHAESINLYPRLPPPLV